MPTAGKSSTLTNPPPGQGGRGLHHRAVSGLEKEIHPLQRPARSVLTFEAELTRHCFCLGKDQIHHSHFSPSFPQCVGKGPANALSPSCDKGHPAIQTQPLQNAAMVAAPEDIILHHFCLKQEHKHIAQQGAELTDSCEGQLVSSSSSFSAAFTQLVRTRWEHEQGSMSSWPIN